MTEPVPADESTPRRISDRGIAYLKSLEALRLTSYRDSAGVWTIGWGHTRGVTRGMTCTEHEAEQFIREDVRLAEERVDRVVTVQTTQDQFDALTIFCFNIGNDAFEHSTLVRLLNTGNTYAAAAEFLKWRYITKNGRKVVSQGLINRRAATRDLFLGRC